jgi:hypothetical protein
MPDITSDTLLEKFKAIVARGEQVSRAASQMQQQLAGAQNEIAELNGASKVLLEMDPTLPQRFDTAMKPVASPPATDPIPPNLAAPQSYVPVAQATSVPVAQATPGVTGGTVTQDAGGITFEAKDGEVMTVKDITVTPNGITLNTAPTDPAAQA